MPAHKESKLLISDKDYKQLLSLISSHPTEAMLSLEEELGEATVLPQHQLPSDVVSMHSTVRVIDLDSQNESELTLVLPHEADIGSHKVSVLAPMGMALIGLRIGQSYEWLMPSGKTKKFKVKEVLPSTS